MDLTGRTALVTGSNRGIGRAIAEALAARPLALLLCGTRDPDGYPPLTPPAGGAREVRPVALDLASRESIDRSVDGLGDAEIDVVVNNAGVMTGGLLEEQDVDEIYAAVQVNLAAVMHLTRLLLPGMLARGRGKVVNNASISGYAYFPAASTYAATKAGVVAFTESLRRETKGTGVTTLHLVTPGVDTEMLDATDEVYGGHFDTSGWDRQQPAEWAAKVLAAIEDDSSILGPGGKTAIAKLASRGPAFLLDRIADSMFTRTPRG
ncbi:MAG: SDR family NAD(P)-dependent oxidoreductase [Solirubrobacterales bacterium]|nr:SDR family NAD(P)-dependent oxidoreductase [Solirubrobacterales bacterium]